MAYLPHVPTVLSSDLSPASEKIAQSLFDGPLEQKEDYNPAKMMARKSLDLREGALEG